jgi:hypothetical protein
MDGLVMQDLIQQQQRQGDALERLSSATEAIARDLWSLVAGSMKIALVYPWPSQPELFRAVLIRSAEEERRLAEALPRFEKAPTGTPMEQWLASENFKSIDVTQLRLGKHDGMFQAPKADAAPPASTRVDIGELKLERDVAELKLELESETGDTEPKLELESQPGVRAA